MSDAVLIADGDLLLPQKTAAGPWFPGVQHGGTIAGVIARAIESTPSAAPMFTTRLTIDMTRKVPMGPTKVDVDITRDGRRVQALACRYVVDGEVVGGATATRVRVEAGAVPDELTVADWDEDEPPTRSADAMRLDLAPDKFDFAQNFTMLREEESRGRVVTWMRLERPFVEGERPSPFVRLAMVADMIASAGSLVDFETYLSVNPDLTINIHRLPETEWLAHRSLVRVSPDGHGQTDAQLFDERGALGRSIKSLLIDER